MRRFFIGILALCGALLPHSTSAKDLAAQLKSTGLIGDWMFVGVRGEGCDPESFHQRWSIDKTMGPIREVVNPARGIRVAWKIIAIQNIGAGIFRITLQGPDRDPNAKIIRANGTSYITFRREGDRYRVLESRLDTGAVLIKNGQYAALGRKGDALIEPCLKPPPVAHVLRTFAGLHQN